MNANSISNESASYLEFPANGSVWDRLNFAVKSAGMAVGMDEWQPWHFQIREGTIELSGQRADPTAASEEATHDEESLRRITMRCGVALYHLRLVLKNFGCLGKVELFPNMAESGLIARVYHTGTASALRQSDTSADTELYRAMNPRNASPATGSAGGRRERGVDGGLLESFEERLGFYAAEKSWLEFAGCETSYRRLVALTSSASRPAGKPRGWLTFIMGTGGTDGFQVEPGGRRGTDMAALGMIKTKTDDKHGWLAAGQMMARAALQARVWQVTSHVFDQGFRNRKSREELRTTIGHKGYVQAVFGVGSFRVEEVDSGWTMLDRADAWSGDGWDMRF